MNKRHFPIVVFCIVLFLIIVMWIWKQNINFGQSIDFQAFDSLGSFMGAIILVFTLYYAYQTYLDSQKNKIEGRFFQLLSIVNETRNNLLKSDEKIFDINIRNVGIFYSEIKNYRKTKEEEKNQQESAWDDYNLLKLAYLFSFYGIENFKDDWLKDIVSSRGTEDSKTRDNEISEITKHLKNRGFDLKYPAFKSIGIYFRQLFQTVTYINDRKELNYREKCQLIKILRVTLNIEEQYLFFINSLSAVGQEWEKNQTNVNMKLITKYNLIKNLPKNYSPINGIDFSHKDYGYPEVAYEDCKDPKKIKDREELEKQYC